MKELTTEQKAKRYDEALTKARNIVNSINVGLIGKDSFEAVFPELKESKDERIRKHLISFFDNLVTFGNASICETKDIKVDDILTWLEKQGENNKWKPSKDEMAALYGLAYITNKMDDKKDEAITKLYQDLKREFFSGVSYENMFPSSPVKLIEEQKPANKVEPNFKVGDKVICLESFDGFIKGQIYTCREEGWIGCDKQGNWTCRLDKFKVVDLQSPAKWSEEDEKIKESIITGLEMLKDGASDKSLIALYNKKIEWLKSLRPKSQWKPSETELRVFEEIIDGTANPCNYHATLHAMLEQLKKLMEE